MGEFTFGLVRGVTALQREPGKPFDCDLKSFDGESKLAWPLRIVSNALYRDAVK